MQNKERIKQLFLKYDADKSQKLDLNELRGLLAELSERDVETISRHEVSFVLRMADQKHQDGEIEREETAAAIAAWNVLQADQDYWGSRFEEFESEKGGDITKPMLAELLKQLNDGTEVTGPELDRVFKQADLNKNGSIDRDEMRVAVAIWYTHVNFSKPAAAKQPAQAGGAGGSGCCTIS
eukprot:SAG22_NODE_2062_length_3062_cov_5.668579_1_plen_181_part_00